MGYHGNGPTVTYPNSFTGMNFQMVTFLKKYIQHPASMPTTLISGGSPSNFVSSHCVLCPNCTLHRGLGPADPLPPAPLLPRASQTSPGRECDECFGSGANVDSSFNSDLRSRELHTRRGGSNIVERMAHLEETVDFSGCQGKNMKTTTTGTLREGRQ